VADRLVAWLHGTPVAVLIRGPEFRIRLEWCPEGIERWGLGSLALSVGLPIGAPASPRDTRGLDFFENMLPEGPALERMAALARVRPVDTYGILAAFGRDCAGAIMVLPDGDRPGGNADSGYSPMTPGDLQRVIGALDVAPLGAAPERGFRPSLAGFQRKALLGRPGDGTWQLPSGDAPSTWILKPDGPHAMAANEATCLRLAAACGLPVPESEARPLDGPAFELPPGLADADSVGIIDDESDGLNFYPEYGMLRDLFGDPALAAGRRYADVLRGYLRAETIAPLPLQRLASAYPDTVDAVFRKILRRRDFTWAEHGEALMRRRKAWYYQHEPRPASR
jgi:HipA-like protein